MLVVKQFTFDAAHRLEGHDGKCSQLHGHTYKLEVGVEGDVFDPTNEYHEPNSGMVLDFGVISRSVKSTVLDKLDHQYLNDVLGFRPTAELLACWIFDALQPLGVSFVRVWETPTSYAEATFDDWARFRRLCK